MRLFLPCVALATLLATAPSCSAARSASPDSGNTGADAAVDLDAALPAAPDAAGHPADAGTGDAALPDLPDAALPDAGPSDAGTPDASPNPSHPGWARYTLAPGSHSATVEQNGAPALPLAGFSFVAGRTYQFIFNPSAMYTLTNPVQPGDQLDWNKLPGLSDCTQVDLAQDGFMFAWRWRLDVTPMVLELAHYANNAGTHLYPPQGILTLDADDLAEESPLTYQLSVGGPGNSTYLFHISGTIRGRHVDVTAEHPRRCATTSPTDFKWAAGFYFGGTSTAPTTITGHIREPG